MPQSYPHFTPQPVGNIVWGAPGRRADRLKFVEFIPKFGRFSFPQLLNYTAVTIHRHAPSAPTNHPKVALQADSTAARSPEPQIRSVNAAKSVEFWANEPALESTSWRGSYSHPHFQNYTDVTTHSWG